jgi:hypothetical protein
VNLLHKNVHKNLRDVRLSYNRQGALQTIGSDHLSYCNPKWTVPRY